MFENIAFVAGYILLTVPISIMALAAADAMYNAFDFVAGTVSYAIESATIAARED